MADFTRWQNLEKKKKKKKRKKTPQNGKYGSVVLLKQDLFLF